MSDTQWPRYYVFKQDTPEEKHQSCGTVHAPDAEMALQIARDVFVRRPACHSLWVAPAEQVLTGPASDATSRAEESTGSEAERDYLIFARPNQRDPHLYQGQVKASNAAEALSSFEQEQPEQASLGAWAVDQESVAASEPGTEAAWFRPAADKSYRHSSFYHPDEMLRKIRNEDD